MKGKWKRVAINCTGHRRKEQKDIQLAHNAQNVDSPQRK